jgi:hypothetical protein
MTTNDLDQKLSKTFGAMRDVDFQRLPEFDRLADVHAPRGITGVRWFRLTGSGAALAALCISLSFLFRPTAHTSIDMQQWAALSKWQPSTDSLLDVSATPWSGSIARTSDHWMNTTSGASGVIFYDERKKP